MIFSEDGRTQLAKLHSPHLLVVVRGIFSDAKERGMRKETGSYRTYSSLVKLQPWCLSLLRKTCLWQVPQFAMKYLSLVRTATLVPEFAVKDLPSAELLPWFLSLLRKTCVRQVTQFAVKDLPLGRTTTLVLEFAVKDLPSTELLPWFLRLQ